MSLEKSKYLTNYSFEIIINIYLVLDIFLEYQAITEYYKLYFNNLDLVLDPKDDMIVSPEDHEEETKQISEINLILLKIVLYTIWSYYKDQKEIEDSLAIELDEFNEEDDFLYNIKEKYEGWLGDDNKLEMLFDVTKFNEMDEERYKQISDLLYFVSSWYEPAYIENQKIYKIYQFYYNWKNNKKLMLLTYKDDKIVKKGEIDWQTMVGGSYRTLVYQKKIERLTGEKLKEVKKSLILEYSNHNILDLYKELENYKINGD